MYVSKPVGVTKTKNQSPNFGETIETKPVPAARRQNEGELTNTFFRQVSKTKTTAGSTMMPFVPVEPRIPLLAAP